MSQSSLFFFCIGTVAIQRICVSEWSKSHSSRGSFSQDDRTSIISRINNVSISNKHVRNYRNKFDDTIFTFSSINGTVSYDNFELGYLTRAIVNIYKQRKYFNNKTMHDASIDIKKLVNSYTEGRQTCEIQSTLDYNVKFIGKNTFNV